MIWFACKQCGKRIARSDDLAGTMVFCDCGHGNRVPWSSTAPEGPLEVEPMLVPRAAPPPGPSARDERGGRRDPAPEGPAVWERLESKRALAHRRGDMARRNAQGDIVLLVIFIPVGCLSLLFGLLLLLRAPTLAIPAIVGGAGALSAAVKILFGMR